MPCIKCTDSFIVEKKYAEVKFWLKVYCRETKRHNVLFCGYQKQEHSFKRAVDAKHAS